MSLNNMVILIGYVGKDLRTQQIQTGKKVRIRVATLEYAGKEVQGHAVTTWHDVVAWDKIAEVAERSFVKGSKIRVHGRIIHRTYHDNTGHKRYITEIKAHYLQNLDR